MDLEAIAARAEAARKATWNERWEAVPDNKSTDPVPRPIDADTEWCVRWSGLDLFDGLSLGYGEMGQEVAEFIAHSIEDVPALVGVLQAVLAACDEAPDPSGLASMNYAAGYRDAQDNIAAVVRGVVEDASRA